MKTLKQFLSQEDVTLGIAENANDSPYWAPLKLSKLHWVDAKSMDQFLDLSGFKNIFDDMFFSDKAQIYVRTGKGMFYVYKDLVMSNPGVFGAQYANMIAFGKGPVIQNYLPISENRPPKEPFDKDYTLELASKAFDKNQIQKLNDIMSFPEGWISKFPSKIVNVMTGWDSRKPKSFIFATTQKLTEKALRLIESKFGKFASAGPVGYHIDTSGRKSFVYGVEGPFLR